MLGRIPGDYAPIPVQEGDLVGYSGDSFILLNPRQTRKGLPRIPDHLWNASILISCVVKDGQPVNFFGGGTNVLCHHARLATLHKISDEWFYKPQEGPRRRMEPLKRDTFMEIGR